MVDNEEDLSEYSADGEVRYKTLWKLKDCAGPTQDGDDVTMIMKYYGEKTDGTHEQLEHTLITKIGKGEMVRSAGDGLYRMCLGEQRRLAIPPHVIHKFSKFLPRFLSGDNNFNDVEMIILDATE